MTTRYNDYLNGITNKVISLDDVNFNVKLVADEYVPDENHNIKDIDKYIITAVNILTKDDILKDTMATIIDKTKEALKIGIQNFPDEICERIESIVSDETKRNKLTELIRSANFDNYQFWQELKENGLGYFVFESVPDGVLCFAEDIEL